MPTRSTLVQLLGRIEKEMQQLIGKVALAADYAAVDAARRVAEDLSMLRSQLRQPGQTRLGGATPELPECASARYLQQVLSAAVQELRHLMATDADGGALGATAAKFLLQRLEKLLAGVSTGTRAHSVELTSADMAAPTPVPAKPAYPRFESGKDMIRRISWSDQEQIEVAKQVPRKVFDLTVQAMQELSSTDTGPFTAYQVIEQVQRLSGHVRIQMPQIYMVLGMIQDHGMIQPAGQGGYQIPINIGALVEKALG